MRPVPRTLLAAVTCLSATAALAQPKPTPVPEDYPGPLQVEWGPIRTFDGPRPGDRVSRMYFVHLDRTDQEAQLFLPGNARTIRGVIVHLGWAYEPHKPHLQEYARARGFAVLGGMWRYARLPDVIPQALAHLAKELDVPGLEHAPLLMMGFSRTGSKAVRFAVYQPERTVSVFFGGSPGLTLGIADKNPERAQRALDALRGIPCITISGSQDAFVGINKEAKRGYFDWERVHYPKIRAARLPVTAACEWGPGHESFNNGALLLPFWDGVWRGRVSDDADPVKGPVALKPFPEEAGYLVTAGDWGTDPDGKLVPASAAADHLGEPVPLREFRGDPATAVWLPDAYTAAVWRAFVERPRGIALAASASGSSIRLAVRSERPEPVESAQFCDGNRLLGRADRAPFEIETLELGSPRGVHSVFAVCMAGGVKYYTAPIQVLGGTVVDQKAGEERARQVPGDLAGLVVDVDALATLRALRADRAQDSASPSPRTPVPAPARAAAARQVIGLLRSPFDEQRMLATKALKEFAPELAEAIRGEIASGPVDDPKIRSFLESLADSTAAPSATQPDNSR